MNTRVLATDRVRSALTHPRVTRAIDWTLNVAVIVGAAVVLLLALVGPSLASIGTRGAETVSGQDAYTYIRHAIQLPSEHIVSGFETADGRSLMPEGLGNDMSAQDLADLIEFLLTQQ